MIRQVKLANWRSHRNLTLDLEAGTTFIVAHNGVGKTSVILGMQWALFGDLAVENPEDHVTLGQDDPASASVTLLLPSGEELRVERTVAQATRPKPTFEPSLDGRAIDNEGTLRSLLRDSFQADPSALSSLCVLPEFVSRRQRRPSEDLLHRHLSEVLGVDKLEAAAEEAARVVKAAAKITRQIRNVDTLEHAERDRAGVRIGELENQLAAAEQHQQQLAADSARERELAATADQWRMFDEALQAAMERRSDLAAKLGSMTGRTVGPEGLDKELSAVERQFQVEADEAREQLGEARARLQLTETLLQQLHEAEGSCPVCLRSLEGAIAEEAASSHETRLTLLATEIEDGQESLERTAAALERVREIRMTVQQIPTPQPPAADRPEADAGALRERSASASERAEEAAAEVATIRHELALLQQRLTEDDDTREARQELRREFRREALAAATEDALRRTAEDIKKGRLEPLDVALRERWKRLMGAVERADDLVFGTQGPVLQVGSEQLGTARMSGAEQAIAETLTRMLVVTSTTACRFLWLDEPLEHLDPAHRRMFATMFIRAIEDGELDQVVITTYEEPLARRLRDVIPEAKLVYLAPS
ncbi:MAG: AAA family ATPase [Gemmatimonadaceae bacterium]|nr:AAA family ATPase [Gemmatimonadaceae bacterium]